MTDLVVKDLELISGKAQENLVIIVIDKRS